MKKLLLSTMFVASLISSGCAQEKAAPQAPQPAQTVLAAVPSVPATGALLLDNFEGEISGGAEGTVDFGAGNGSSVQVSAASDILHSGKQSLKAEFDAVSGGYIYIAKGSGLDAKNASWLLLFTGIDWTKYTALSFWMYGVDSKEQIAVDVKDSGNELWRCLVSDDFKGWKQIICPLKDFFARGDWQPDNADKNATMDFPLKSYQFEPLPVAKGVLYFDDVELAQR